MIPAMPNFKDITPNYAMLATSLRNMLSNKTFCVFVSDEVDGVLIGCATQLWYASEKLACDLVVYTEPSASPRTARALIIAFEAWAKQMGCYAVRLGVTTGCNVEETMQFYARCGYVQSGAVAQKGLPCVLAQK
jgi:GNAT superfamily N-acetyltransferase